MILPRSRPALAPSDAQAAASATSPSGGGPRVNALVDGVLVISVRSLHDRIDHIRREMARAGIAFDWVFDFDPGSIPPDLIARQFAPSDLELKHQSLVLKHMHTWRLCVERGWRRVLVFEDDVVLAPDFAQTLAAALQEADAIDGAKLLYLGCGQNRYVTAADTDGPVLVPGGPLTAADALVLDREGCAQRLAWVQTHRITRPADWLLREIDADIGIAHYWLRQPVVEQGSMNGRFNSLLDEKRRSRGRWYAWLRFRWDKWRHRLVGGRRIASRPPPAS